MKWEVLEKVREAAAQAGIPPIDDFNRDAVTAELAKQGAYELYKTSDRFDATEKNKQWLGDAAASS